MNILVLDDDPAIPKMLKLMLSRSKFASSASIFYRYEDLSIFFDTIIKELEGEEMPFLLFLDINMPDIDGWESLSLLETNYPNLKIDVVIISSSIDPYDKEKAKNQEKVIAYLEKPISIGKLDEIHSIYFNSSPKN